MNPKIYLVGGAVRDYLLGRESSDRDYVVVGATPEWMLEQGYKQVGASFPVFLHPETGDEYALARQERKTGVGYNGFTVEYDPSVTLEEDLMRRDLTINSMALDMNTLQIIDPYDGISDLHNRILRHTSVAFEDDPLRVLRLARFVARYPSFEVHRDTLELAKKIVQKGELSTLPNERIKDELFKGLNELNPAKMLKVITEVGAMDVEPIRRYFFITGDSFNDWLNVVFTSLEALKIEVSFETKFLMCLPDVAFMSEESLDDLKINKNLHRLAKHAHEMDVSLMIDSLITEEEALRLLNLVRYDADAITPEMKSILEAMHIEHLFMKYKTRFVENLERLDAASRAIKKLDLRSIAENGEKGDVKLRINRAKLEAIVNISKQEEK